MMNGEIVESYPCKRCISYMKKVGIKKIYYSTSTPDKNSKTCEIILNGKNTKFYYNMEKVSELTKVHSSKGEKVSQKNY